MRRLYFVAGVSLILTGVFIWDTEMHSKSVSLLSYRVREPLSPDDEELVRFIRRSVLKPSTGLEYKLDESDQVYNSIKWGNGWPMIHRHIQHFFANQTSGFFVEAGALDGEYHSHTLWLEKELGWQGLLVEPNPIAYSSLVSKNRKAWTANACLAAKGYPEETTFFATIFSRKGTTRLYRNALKWAMLSQAKESEKEETATGKQYFTSVCYPIQSLIKALGVTLIDVFVLDIEGNEKGVLETFPWEEIKVRCWVVEHFYNPVNIDYRYDPEFVTFFKNRGYSLIEFGTYADYIFVLQNDTSLNTQKD